ncbi:MAG: vWA domain-containing protein, partial [Fusobacteriaceae bacterium]
MIKFNNPSYLLLLFPLIYFFFIKKDGKTGLKIPTLENFRTERKKTYKHLCERYLIFLSLALMAIGLARPQEISQNMISKKNGIDIALVLDLSQSMLQRDFNPNRLEKAKELLQEFVEGRGNDRISLVVFGGDAYTKVPLTFDHNVVKEFIAKTGVDDITSNNRTAIGMGLGVAINRFQKSNAKSKVIILMTDGENNAGELSPLDSAKLAKGAGIKVYTIGIGAREIEVPSFFGSRKIANRELDENLLQKIAEETGGEYFRADNAESFRNIFKKIDALEKSELEG